MSNDKNELMFYPLVITGLGMTGGFFMKKGRLIYVDEDGTCYVTRKIECDMRPVRSGCGMHIVNSFRYGGFRSLYEFDCFVVRFIQKQEKEKAEDLSGLTAIWPECEDLTELFARLNTEEYCYFINEGGQKQWPGGTLHPDSMLVICGQEPAEVVYRRTDVSEPPVGETEFVNILETLRIEEKLPVLAKDHIIYLLELLMRDQGGEISYFVHDLDFGRNYEPGLLSDELGKIDLSCSQSLYQELVQTGF